MSVIVLEYMFSSVLTAPPVGNQIRLNAGQPYTAVTRAYVRNVTTDGADMRELWLSMPVGGELYVQDKNDSLNFTRFAITAPPIGPAADYVEVPIAWTDSGGGLPAQAALCLLKSAVLEAEAPPPPLMPAGPGDFFHVTVPTLLVPLDEAKAHLHVADPALDAEVTRKTQAAQHVILDYLKHAADPNWTAVTLPDPVKSGILLMLTHLYERRGDDPETDEDLWAAIGRLLIRFRDPAVA